MIGETKVPAAVIESPKFVYSPGLTLPSTCTFEGSGGNCAVTFGAIGMSPRCGTIGNRFSSGTSSGSSFGSGF